MSKMFEIARHRRVHEHSWVCILGSPRVYIRMIDDQREILWSDVVWEVASADWEDVTGVRIAPGVGPVRAHLDRHQTGTIAVPVWLQFRPDAGAVTISNETEDVLLEACAESFVETAGFRPGKEREKWWLVISCADGVAQIEEQAAPEQA